MAITFGVASAATLTAASGRTGNGDLSVALPTNWAAGQLAILAIYSDQGTMSTPSNWNAVSGQPFGSGTEKLGIWWKVLAVGEAAPVSTIAGSGTNISHVGAIVTYDGADSVGVVATGTAGQGTGTPMTATAGTTPIAGCFAIGIAGRGDNEDVNTQTFGGSATGVTERTDAGTSAGNDSLISIFDKEIASAGTTGNSSAVTSATDPWVSQIVIIRPKITLVVQDGAHAHTADNLALTQHNILAIQDATHAHTADNLTIVYTPVSGTPLIIQDGAHAHTADNLDLTQHNVLAIQDAAHAHTADNLALVQHNVLVIQDASHAHTADNLSLTQHNVLVVQDAAHAHAADNVTLTANAPEGTLVIQDGIHAHTADNLTLTQHNVLVIQDATHAHAADNLVLVEHSIFTPPTIVGGGGTYRRVRRSQDPEEYEIIPLILGVWMLEDD